MSRTELQPSDSIEAEDPHNEEKKKQKSRRPASTLPPTRVVVVRSPSADVWSCRHRISATAIEGMAVSNTTKQKANEYTENPRPILTPKTVLPILFAVGIIFAPIGGLLLWASESVRTKQGGGKQGDTKLSLRFKSSELTTQIAIQLPTDSSAKSPRPKFPHLSSIQTTQ